MSGRRAKKASPSPPSTSSPSTNKRNLPPPTPEEEEEELSTTTSEVKKPENEVVRAKEDYFTSKGRFKDEKDRQQWALNMRLKFTVKEMLNEDGTINHK
jgi:hypothetical protein